MTWGKGSMINLQIYLGTHMYNPFPIPSILAG